MKDSLSQEKLSLFNDDLYKIIINRREKNTPHDHAIINTILTALANLLVDQENHLQVLENTIAYLRRLTHQTKELKELHNNICPND